MAEVKENIYIFILTKFCFNLTLSKSNRLVHFTLQMNITNGNFEPSLIFSPKSKHLNNNNGKTISAHSASPNLSPHSYGAIHNLSRFENWRQLSRPWAYRRHWGGVALACITAHKYNREKIKRFRCDSFFAQLDRWSYVCLHRKKYRSF